MQYLYDPDNLPVLYHEFMHVFQAIKSDSLKDNMSNGYMMAKNILNKRMALMNLVSLKNSLNNQKLSNEQLKGFLAACIYYTEYLERAAYLQNVYNEIAAGYSNRGRHGNSLITKNRITSYDADGGKSKTYKYYEI